MSEELNIIPETKVCSKCKIEKDIKEFREDNRRKDGHHSSCIQCQKEYHAYKWKEDAKYRELTLNKAKEWYREHHLEALIDRALMRSYQLKVPRDTKEELYKCLESAYEQHKCEFCGREIVVNNGYSNNNSGTIDRLIPEKGYIVGNVSLLCLKCNRLKNNLGYQQLINFGNWIKERIEKSS